MGLLIFLTSFVVLSSYAEALVSSSYAEAHAESHAEAHAESHAEAYASESCLPLFLRYSPQHTYCKPKNPNCNIMSTLITQADISLILKEHNTYRSKVAVGGEVTLPTATNMLQMVWDDELAAVAQKHANQCLFEHDCSSCRRVQNYGVGQNLAIEETNSPTVPQPNWPSAIKSWYDEITFFSKGYIDPFLPPPSEPTYGHFSQVVWADSWRVGCGYALYKEGKMYKKLYVCNYGPNGNIAQKSMYKGGAPCSACPKNSCCGSTCGADLGYPGLCKITDDKGPVYTPQGSYIFYCDFQEQPDCKFYVKGPNKWLIYNTLSGSYIGIVLKGGEESTMVFSTRLKPSLSKFCFVTNYRKGPNVAGEKDSNKATETFTIVENNYAVNEDLPTFGGDLQQQFSQFSMNLGWYMETEVKITFSVPAGQSEQFFEIQSLYATEGECGK